MFDAKRLIDMMMKGAAGSQPQGGSRNVGELGDLLRQVLGAGATAPGRDASSAGELGGLGDLLSQLGQGPVSRARAGAGSAGDLGDLGASSRKLGDAGSSPSENAVQGGGLENILERLQQQLGGAGGQPGGLMDILGQVLSQATSGVQEGAKRVDHATGASDRLREATGQSPADVLEQLKNLLQRNPGAAAAGAGGLGAIVLGTKTGRSLAGKAITLGGLALIGGLAYKALQNFQSGKPLITGATDITAAPPGSGFETSAVTQQAAVSYLRAMIAAAAADGRVDTTEQQKILGNMKQLGLDADAEDFLANELNNPATPEQLAAGISTQEEAVQLFTAARIAVNVDTAEEHAFLVELAQALGIEGELVNHIDATTRAAA